MAWICLYLSVYCHFVSLYLPDLRCTCQSCVCFMLSLFLSTRRHYTRASPPSPDTLGYYISGDEDKLRLELGWLLYTGQ